MDIDIELENKIRSRFEEENGFIRHNNMHIIEVKKNYAKLYIDLTEESLNPNGTVHGGLLFGLADTAMGSAAVTNGRNVVTINSQIDYLKPGRGKKITAEATSLKVGRTTSVYRCNIYDENERLICTATGTYFFID